MPRYKAWLPAWASVLYVLETDKPITDEAELKRRMLEEGESQGSLCHQCSDVIQCDGDYAFDEVKPEDFEVYEDEE